MYSCFCVSLFFFFQFSSAKLFSSNECPDCGNIIEQARRVYLNHSISNDSDKKSPVKTLNKLNVINELNRQKITDLHKQTQNQKDEIATLKCILLEKSQMKYAIAAAHKFEMEHLENMVIRQQNKSRTMRYLTELKDQKINELNSALKLRKIKYKKLKRMIKQMRTENAVLNQRITQFEQTINLRRITRSAFCRKTMN